DVRVNKFVPAVVAPSSYILMGNEYAADVFIAASDSTQTPEIIVNGNPLPIEGGVGKYKVRPGKEGENKWGGIIKIKSPDGSTKEYPFESSFTASKPSTVISATKMNVFYKGLANPLSVSVPGIDASKVKATISQGTLAPDPNVK